MGPVKPATQMSATAPKSSRRETYLGKELLNIWKISGLSSKESHYTVGSLGLAGDRQLLCRLREKYQGPLVLHLPLAMSMENDMYIASLDRDSTVIGEISQHSPSNPLIQCYSSDLNNQSHIISGISMLAGEQSKHISNIHAGVCFINPASITADCSSLVTSHGKSIAVDASNPMENTEFQEHLAGGMSITPASLAAILAARIGLQENLENSAVFPPPLCLIGAPALGPFFNNWQGNSNPLSATTFEDSSYNEVPGSSSSSKWNDNKFHKAPEIDVTGWTATNVAAMINHSCRSSNYSNELSLSLTTSASPGHCSEVSCSDVTQCMNGTMPGLEQASCSSRELSVSLGGNKYVQFSPEVLGSRYLVGIQEILAQIARYSFENLERVNCSAAGTRAGGNKSTSAFPPRRRILMNHSANSMHETRAESPLQRHAAESKKSQLLTLLQLVDSRYSQCLDEIHTVVSAFHAATELDPQLHAHFALQTISILYKDLRERISNHILAMGSNSNNLCSEENEWSFETSFLQKQWALQQLKRKDHQLWRPQRGLPERSVSVLRAWMFQNFLHPYPKDAEKHLLAVKCGLTRSQVSNWFINARVRLWKPMIEEMYTEMDKRKVCRNEGTESSHGNRISMSNQRFNVN